jgi:hypothetical protein
VPENAGRPAASTTDGKDQAAVEQVKPTTPGVATLSLSSRSPGDQQADHNGCDDGYHDE